MKIKNRQMVKWIWCFSGLFLFCFTSSVYGETKPFKIVCDKWPPYQNLVGDEVTGISADLVRQAFKEMEIPIHSIKSYPWKRALAYVKKGDADALFSANFNPERQAYVYYPEEPLIVTPWVLWRRNSDPPNPAVIKGDFKGMRIGVVSGYTYTEDFWASLKAHGYYNPVTSDAQNFKMLAAGRIDLVAAELGNGLYLTRKLKLSHIVPLMTHPIKTDGLYIIFSRKTISREFVDQFSKALVRVKQGDDYKKIVSEHLSPYYRF